MNPTRRPQRGLTAVPGIRVGHATDAEAQTGCTAVLTPAGAVAGVDVGGGAPATRETDLLRPGMLVERVHAVLLTGGSAFGLAAADGVMRYLEEQGIGFEVGRAGEPDVVRVPIVPAAALFDLGVGRADVRPTAEMGYRAARAATDGPVPEGMVGAGTGATVGHLFGAGAMRGGLGTAAVDLPGGAIVAALAVVNAFGDVRDDHSGEIIAGARSPSGEFVDTARAFLETGKDGVALGRTNTTLVVVATNAGLTKAEAGRLARTTQDGLARVISPAHTMFDGDIVFALSLGEAASNLAALGAAGVEVVARAITRAVRLSNGL
ncbi:MAG: P1 family peptidase [bacterium]